MSERMPMDAKDLEFIDTFRTKTFLPTGFIVCVTGINPADGEQSLKVYDQLDSVIHIVLGVLEMSKLEVWERYRGRTDL